MSVDNLETHETNSVKTTELPIFVLAEPAHAFRTLRAGTVVTFARLVTTTAGLL